jgi:hypothetical protein
MLRPRSALFATAVVVAALFFGALLLPADAAGRSISLPCPTILKTDFWYMCSGTIRLPNGDKYVGEFNGGKYNGKGTYIKRDGTKYVGQYKNGQPNGHGTYTYSQGGIYVGEFIDGKRNGHGAFTFRNGDKFVGYYKNGQPNGQGTYTYRNGEKYVGEFNNWQPNGQGIYTFLDGEQYIGEFNNGQPSGQGVYTYGNETKQVGRFNVVADQESISMENSGGVYFVSVRFNDTITLNAVVDSGASDVSIPADIVLTLMRSKTVTKEDYLGEQTYVLADGSTVPFKRFRIRSMRVGNTTIENVIANVAPVSAEILLGQGFLKKFK